MAALLIASILAEGESSGSRSAVVAIALFVIAGVIMAGHKRRRNAEAKAKTDESPPNPPV